MEISSAAAGSCTLAVAGLRVAVECNQPAVAAELRRHYQPFLTMAASHWTARVEWTGSLRSHAAQETGGLFRDGCYYFTAAGYQGVIQPTEGLAWLRLSSREPLAEIDYLLRVVYSLLAWQQGGLLFHAAGIARRGRGYLFCGHSGSGKTTVSRLSGDATVLNDDLVLIMPTDQASAAGRMPWSIHATPFWNPTQMVPTAGQWANLTALFRLVQAPQVEVMAMEASEALAELIANTPILPADPGLGGPLLAWGERLLATVPAYRLRFLPDDSFWPAVERVIRV